MTRGATDSPPPSRRPWTRWRAYSITGTAPSAPTYVCLDENLQEQPLPEPPAIPDVSRDRSPRSHGPDALAVRTTLEFLGRARRPLFLMSAAC
jgi:acetolactate synthase I/II/III large subunit